MLIPERWQDDWMLCFIIFTTCLIILFEWIDRIGYIPTFSFRGWFKENFGTPTSSIIGTDNKKDDNPQWIPWRDWKPAGAIPTLLATPSRPNQINTTIGNNNNNILKGGKWGWAPPQPPCDIAIPIENANNQPEFSGIPGTMPIGVFSENIDRPEKNQIRRQVLSWQPGRTRVCLTSWVK